MEHICVCMCMHKLRDEKQANISDENQNNKHNSRSYFNTVNKIINHTLSGSPVSSSDDYIWFRNVFVNEINGLRSSVNLGKPHFSHVTCPQFSTISLQELSNTISHMRPSSCSTEMLPPRFV